MLHRLRAGWLAPLAGLLLSLGLVLPFSAPASALAHERRQVGPYTFVVGWTTEPALTGEMNGVDLRISKTDGGAPVEGADQTLKLQIAFGGGPPQSFPIRARFGQPGAYTADLIPTRAGSYIFTLGGTVEGNAINEKFESGPNRFDDVKPAETVEFPAPAAAATAPAGQTSSGAQPAAATTDDVGRRYGIGGMVLGGLGLLMGAAALLTSRRPAGRPA